MYLVMELGTLSVEPNGSATMAKGRGRINKEMGTRGQGPGECTLLETCNIYVERD